MLLFTIIIYVICLVVEVLRQLLFKLIQVPKLMNIIQNKSDKLYDKYIAEKEVHEENPTDNTDNNENALDSSNDNNSNIK